MKAESTVSGKFYWRRRLKSDADSSNLYLYDTQIADNNGVSYKNNPYMSRLHGYYWPGSKSITHNDYNL